METQNSILLEEFNMADEIWKDIPGFYGRYQASSFGRIRSVDRKEDIRGYNIKGTILKCAIGSNGYYMCSPCVDGVAKVGTVHRLIAKTFLSDYSDDLFVEHKDTNRLNCSVNNLRMSTVSQNSYNASKQEGMTSKFKGVCLEKNTSRYTAQIKYNKKKIHIRSSRCPAYLARLYDKKAIELFGEFARTNEMEGLLPPISRMNKPVVVICGFSASGKDTLARLIEREGYNFVISTTTRPPRDGEYNGNPYYFISKELFKEKSDNKEFIEIREYHTVLNGNPDTWYYGVHRDAILEDKPNVVVLDILGLREFKSHFGDRCVSFFISADKRTRKRRCQKRGDFDQLEFERRYNDDKKVFTTKVVNKETDHTILSSDPEENLLEIMSILEEY